jgi:hypothetical protein
MMRTTIHDGTLFICLQYAPLVPVRVRLVYLPVCQKSNGRAIWPSAGFAAAIHAPSWVQGGESSATVVILILFLAANEKHHPRVDRYNSCLCYSKVSQASTKSVKTTAGLKHTATVLFWGKCRGSTSEMILALRASSIRMLIS